MKNPVPTHYSGGGNLAEKIASDLLNRGIEPTSLSAAEFEALDEFHFRGRKATLEISQQMNLSPGSKVLDIGSGLGGVSRTIAQEYSAQVIGVDLTQQFCDAATAISDWVRLSDKTQFHQGDATNLPFDDGCFDSAVTVHVAMNIPDKAAMYSEARRVLKPGSRFGIYDILQGEGGDVLYPAPWAAEARISHLASPKEMSRYLINAGFNILKEVDSTQESYEWLSERTKAPRSDRFLPVTTQLLFGSVSGEMTRNQLKCLQERRMLTYSFLCEV